MGLEKDKKPDDKKNKKDKLSNKNKKNTKNEVEKLILEKTELEQLVKRIAADFDNYKKRVMAEKAELKELYNKEIIKKILGIVDNFELALNNTENHEKFVKGVEMIYSMLINMLSDEGVKAIENNDDKFDPKIHEPIMTKKGDEDNKIVEIVQKGYFYRNSVLRAAKVIVSKKKNKEDKKE